MRTEFLSNSSCRMCKDARHTHYSVVEGIRLQYRPDKTSNVEAAVTTRTTGHAIWQQFTTVTAYAPTRGSNLAFACVLPLSCSSRPNDRRGGLGGQTLILSVKGDNTGGALTYPLEVYAWQLRLTSTLGLRGYPPAEPSVLCGAPVAATLPAVKWVRSTSSRAA